MKFVKMHGIGNDFVCVDAAKEKVSKPDRLAREICDRHCGVGSDGLILILPSRSADFRMRMWNPDGSEAEMCGNGIRCVGKFVYERGLTKRTELAVETLAGPIGLRLLARGGTVGKVRVDMGPPRRTRSEIPMKGTDGPVVSETLQVGERTFVVTCVSMGNPHCVVFVEDVAQFPVEKLGPLIEHHPIFPRRSNVEFVQVVSRSELIQRTWERGAGETSACGTGACGTVVAAVLNGRTDRKVVNHLRGGDLEIEWSEENDRVYMTGAAVEVFQGEW